MNLFNTIIYSFPSLISKALVLTFPKPNSLTTNLNVNKIQWKTSHYNLSQTNRRSLSIHHDFACYIDESDKENVEYTSFFMREYKYNDNA